MSTLQKQLRLFCFGAAPTGSATPCETCCAFMHQQGIVLGGIWRTQWRDAHTVYAAHRLAHGEDGIRKHVMRWCEGNVQVSYSTRPLPAATRSPPAARQPASCTQERHIRRQCTNDELVDGMKHRKRSLRKRPPPHPHIRLPSCHTAWLAGATSNSEGYQVHQIDGLTKKSEPRSYATQAATAGPPAHSIPHHARCARTKEA